MERFVKGDIVVLPFPFSDLSNSKKRPAFVLASLSGEDIILCQITSNARINEQSIILTNDCFKNGSLNTTSIIRPYKIFTADKSIIQYKAGTLKNSIVKKVDKEIIKILSLQ